MPNCDPHGQGLTPGASVGITKPKINVRLFIAIAFLACSLGLVWWRPNYYTTASTLIRGFYFVSTPICACSAFLFFRRSFLFGFGALMIGFWNWCAYLATGMCDCEGN